MRLWVNARNLSIVSMYNVQRTSSCLTFSNAHCKPKCRLEMNILFLDNLLFNRSILAGLYMFIGPSTIKWPDPFVHTHCSRFSNFNSDFSIWLLIFNVNETFYIFFLVISNNIESINDSLTFKSYYNHNIDNIMIPMIFLLILNETVLLISFAFLMTSNAI